ncbi:hypothetical protein [Thermogemmata fonticola]|uniref:Dynamin family protein n=1 Tax=Thermogemmata fonticola TaxID=2755323 RepID=A0A7V8VF84_9BACT|nr:hypothetical protein [Thermogemmata fonticola]MBA2226737.1 hypothetical protein [Thermogemmata fonticola]
MFRHKGLEEVLQEWQKLRQAPVLGRTAPPPPVVRTLEQALDALGQRQRVQEVDAQAELCRQRLEMAATPILGVLGELNAGKSSVVARFLSPAGRCRLPRGLEEAFGTHRFVYWFPRAWQQDEQRYQALLRWLAQAHGHAPEPLHEKPEIAFQQYRSGRENPALIPVPLVAYDEQLQHFALLDCPDVQTEDHPPASPAALLGSSSPPPNRRLEFVTQAARLCSAFLLVWERSQVRDRLVGEFLHRLRQVMAQVPIFLLINKVRPKPDALSAILQDEDIQRIREKYHIQDIYVAMDFDIPNWERYTPASLQKDKASLPNDEAGKSPVFFRLDANTAADPHAAPATVGLAALFQQLPPAELQKAAIDSAVTELRQQIAALLDSLDTWRQKCEKTTRSAWQGLLQFCLELFQDQRGEPIQIYNLAFQEKLNKVIMEQAPWYVKMANWFHDRIHSGVELVRKMIPLSGLRHQAEQWRSHLQHWAGGFVDAAELAQRSLQQRWVPADWPMERLEYLWKEVLEQLRRFEHQVSEADLRPMAEDFWRHAPAGVGWRSALSILGSMAAVAGLATAAIDGGATLMAGYSFSAAVASAIPGLGALTVGAIGTGTALAVCYAGLIQHNSLPYLSAFFTLACDAFGLPHRLDDQPLTVTFGRGEQRRPFTLPQVAVPSLRVCHPLPNIGLWHWTGPGRQAWENARRSLP